MNFMGSRLLRGPVAMVWMAIPLQVILQQAVLKGRRAEGRTGRGILVLGRPVDRGQGHFRGQSSLVGAPAHRTIK